MSDLSRRFTKSVSRPFVRGVSRLIDDLSLVAVTWIQKKATFGSSPPGAPLRPDAFVAEALATPPQIHWPDADLTTETRLRVELPGVATETVLDFLPASGRGADTLLVYHHGLFEIEHDLTARAFQQLRGLEGRVDVVALKAPHHASKATITGDFLSDRSYFTQCICHQSVTAKQVARKLRPRYRHVVLAGTSLGGIVTLCEAIEDPAFDLYLPLLAGPVMHDVMLHSTFTRAVESNFLRTERGSSWFEHMDIQKYLADWAGPPIRPLLARSDRLFRLEEQRQAFAEIPNTHVTAFEGSHRTGGNRTRRLARHVRHCIKEVCWAEPPDPAASSDDALAEDA